MTPSTPTRRIRHMKLCAAHAYFAQGRLALARGDGETASFDFNMAQRKLAEARAA